MTRFPKRSCISLLVALLLPHALFAQEWTDWDGDTDGALTFEEFSQGLATRMNFAARDADGDGKLSQDELGGWFFSQYDRDTTDALDEAELATLEEDVTTDGLWEPEGVTDVEAVDSETTADEPGDVVTPNEVVTIDRAELPNWDLDGDGLIVAHEFMDGLGDWGTFAEFDADEDGGVTEDELAREIFARYDEDGIGLIAEPELAVVGDDLGDGGFWDA